jgi:integrase
MGNTQSSRFTRIDWLDKVHLLQSGVPFNVIALWFGHESTNTTHRYVEADLEMKEMSSPEWKRPTPSCDDTMHQTRT